MFNRLVVGLLLCLPGLHLASAHAQEKDSVRVQIGKDSAWKDSVDAVMVVLENNLYRAVLRTRRRANWLIPAAGGRFDTAIMDWIIKSAQEDQASWGLNGSEHWTHARDAFLIYNSPAKKIVRLIQGENCGLIDYTIYAGSPVIRIDYIHYGNNKNHWFNIVDIGTPGGLKERHQATTRIFGQEQWIRKLQYHEDSYWNIFRRDKYNDDPSAGSLNYKDHLIMVLANPANGRGFGRVIPLFQDGNRGGTMVLKLLWDIGFENFAGTGQMYQPPFVSYLFVFEKGLDQALQLGKKIVDGTFLTQN